MIELNMQEQQPESKEQDNTVNSSSKMHLKQLLHYSSSTKQTMLSFFSYNNDRERAMNMNKNQTMRNMTPCKVRLAGYCPDFFLCVCVCVFSMENIFQINT